MLRVSLISKTEKRVTGLSRYVESLQAGLSKISGINATVIEPDPLKVPPFVNSFVQKLGIDLSSFHNSYPFFIRQNSGEIFHLTNQNLATLYLFQDLKPSVITIHDIIPLLVKNRLDLRTKQRKVEQVFFRLSLGQIRKAQAVIVISNYTRQTVIDWLDLPSEKIHVVHRVVDLERFHPQVSPQGAFTNLGLDPNLQYILYVGSEDPRKNIRTLINAFASIHQKFPKVRLVKAGAVHFAAERQNLLDLIGHLGLEKKVIFIENLKDEHLPALYKAATVFVLPSFYEGFGLPALEAMACGTPVIASNAASLPEVVGDGGLLFDPNSPQQLADMIGQILENPTSYLYLTHSGQTRAREFSQPSQAFQTLEVYKTIL